MIRIYALKISQEEQSDRYQFLFRHIDPEKQNRIVKSRNGQSILWADILVRTLLCIELNVKNSALVFEKSEYGKPYLLHDDHHHYNVSHSGEWIAVALSREPIGIDIEQVRPIDLNVAKTCCTDQEYAFLISLPSHQRLRSFYEIWTVKESFVKAIGKGLHIPFHTFCLNEEESTIAFHQNYDLSAHHNTRYCYKKYGIEEDYKLAVCSTHSQFPLNINVINAEALFLLFQSCI